MSLLPLLFLFQTKHLIADFLLQTEWMQGKFGRFGWVLPLAAHCAVHAALTLAICLWVRPEFWWLALVDFAVHFVMDRTKASPNLLGRFKVLSNREFPTATPAEKRSNRFYWWSVGFDQYVHQLTNLALAAYIALV